MINAGEYKIIYENETAIQAHDLQHRLNLDFLAMALEWWPIVLTRQGQGDCVCHGLESWSTQIQKEIWLKTMTVFVGVTVTHSHIWSL